MSNMDSYWKCLVSTALRFLKEQGKNDAVSVIKNSTFEIEFNNHDNWNGGIDYWDLVFQLRYEDFMVLGKKKSTVGSEIFSALEQFHTDNSNRIANVIVRPVIEYFIDWSAVLPFTKANVIENIREEQNILTDVATGKLSFKAEGVEDSYQERHSAIMCFASKAGFDYPVRVNTLAEWWGEVKKFPTYSERREYICSLFSPLLTTLRESDDNVVTVNFQQIASKSGTVKRAVEDAELFIREEKYDSSVDRVHTAFHGYLRELLKEHGISYKEDDSLPALYTKLHGYYGDSIQPHDVGEHIKGILRSAGGVINAVNELRNNNTLAHPNGQLIQAREAHLVIRMVNSVVEYIEDVENQVK